MVEQRLIGVPAAPGIAVGTALLYRAPDAELPGADRPVDPAAEIARLNAAITAADAAIARTEAQLQQEGKRNEAGIFTAHRMLLNDPELRERALLLIRTGRRTAAEAVAVAGEEQATELIALDDPYLSARATDIRDVVAQVQRSLVGARSLGERLTSPAIVVARDLGPSDLMSAPRDRLLGLLLAEGGRTGHAAILARALEIPAVVGLGPALLAQVTDDATLAIDGATGEVMIAPDAPTLERMCDSVGEQLAQQAALRRQRDLPCVTRDGREIHLMANVALVEEAQKAREWGAAGVGLLRTELLFLERPALPDEAEQLALYSAIAAALPGKPIIARTLDVGNDKRLPMLPLTDEANPALGWRGIRIGLSRPDLLLPQLRALLRAGATADVRIMLPMIATVDEVRRVRALLDQAREQLRTEGLPCAANPQLGVMIEIPAAALTADSLAREVDFFSIGTNDLVQYTLACDRTNHQVSHLCQPLEPAVLRLIAMTAEAAHRHGRMVGMCGEMAGDPALTALLIGLGVDELSCAPATLPLVRAAVRATDAAAAAALAREALAAASLAEVQALLFGRNQT